MQQLWHWHASATRTRPRRASWPERADLADSGCASGPSLSSGSPSCPSTRELKEQKGSLESWPPALEYRTSACPSEPRVAKTVLDARKQRKPLQLSALRTAVQTVQPQQQPTSGSFVLSAAMQGPWILTISAQRGLSFACGCDNGALAQDKCLRTSQELGPVPPGSNHPGDGCSATLLLEPESIIKRRASKYNTSCTDPSRAGLELDQSFHGVWNQKRVRGRHLQDADNTSRKLLQSKQQIVSR